VQPAALDSQDQTASRVSVARLDKLAPLVQSVLLDHWVQLGHKDSKDRLASRVIRERRAFQVILAAVDREATSEILVNQGKLARRDREVTLVILVLLDLKDNRAIKVRLLCFFCLCHPSHGSLEALWFRPVRLSVLVYIHACLCRGILSLTYCQLLVLHCFPYIMVIFYTVIKMNIFAGDCQFIDGRFLVNSVQTKEKQGGG